MRSLGVGDSHTTRSTSFRVFEGLTELFDKLAILVQEDEKQAGMVLHGVVVLGAPDQSAVSPHLVVRILRSARLREFSSSCGGSVGLEETPQLICRSSTHETLR